MPPRKENKTSTETSQYIEAEVVEAAAVVRSDDVVASAESSASNENDDDDDRGRGGHGGRWWKEWREQSRTVVPALIGMLLNKFPWYISLRFVAPFGAETLAAAALATTLSNVTGMSLSVGLSSAISTLAGQARGSLSSNRTTKGATASKTKTLVTQLSSSTIEMDEDELEQAPLVSNANGTESIRDEKNGPNNDTDSGTPLQPLVFLYRGLFIHVLAVIPVVVWWSCGIASTLVALGQGVELSEATQHYLRILAPGLVCTTVNWTLNPWLMSMEMADIPARAAAIGLLLHVPFNLLYVHVFGMGYTGAALATTTFQILQPLITVAYTVGTPRRRQILLDRMYAHTVGRTRLSFWREAKLAVGSPSGVLQYLGLAIPGMVMISEWWASETAIFLSGRLSPSPELALGAMTLYQSINTCCFMFPKACSVGGSTRVSMLLGSGDHAGARLSAFVSVGCATATSTILGLVLFLAPHGYFPSWFAPDEVDLVRETSRTVPLLSLYVLGDGIQSALTGVVKGCGRQATTMPVIVVAYWVVGLPLAYYLAFVRHDGDMWCNDDDHHRDDATYGIVDGADDDDDGSGHVLRDPFCGVVGLVTGMTTGTWLHCTLLAAIVVGTIEWRSESRKAMERVRLDSEIEQLVVERDEPHEPKEREQR